MRELRYRFLPGSNNQALLISRQNLEIPYADNIQLKTTQEQTLVMSTLTGPMSIYMNTESPYIGDRLDFMFKGNDAYKVYFNTGLSTSILILNVNDSIYTGTASFIFNGVTWLRQDDIETLLGSLPVYDSAAAALSDGVVYGSWFFNTLNNTVSKAWNSVAYYSALKSVIDFTNNGGDDYTIGLYISPVGQPQLPYGVTILSYDYDILHWIGGTETHLDTGSETTDYTFTTSGNGAGVYQIRQTYQLSNGKTNGITRLILVDNAGTILKSVSLNGFTVLSVSGLDVTLLFDVDFLNYDGNRVALTFDGNTITSLVNGYLNNTVIVPTHAGDIMILGSIELDSSWSDFNGDFYGNNNVVIN